jgi:rhamnulokinase
MNKPSLRPVAADRRAFIAVDLGAESCRVCLLRWLGDEPDIRLVLRVPNGPVRSSDGYLRWPLKTIIEGVEEGVRRCSQLAPEGIASIAVDGWAVDYVTLDDYGRVVEDPFCYRDDRNTAALAKLHKCVSPERLRKLTGLELQPLNTIYQLYADKLAGRTPRRWLNLPEYMLYRWGGEPVAERTNASHTGLLEFTAANWSSEIFGLAGLDMPSAPPRIVPSGTVLGKLSGPLSQLAGLRDTYLIAPACHDTVSAIAGIAGTGDDWAYISCGTWSLVGALIDAPLNSPDVQADNFTNLAAVGGLTCFHKSVNGMWILKQCQDHWAEEGKPWDLAELLSLTDLEDRPANLLEVDDLDLLRIGDMPGRINAQLRRRGLPTLSEESEQAPRMISLFLHSLADRYAQLIGRIRLHTGRTLRRVVMVGGGAQNVTLRRLTSECTGLEVIRGPLESATIGNFAIQQAVVQGIVSPDSPQFVGEVAGWAATLQCRTLAVSEESEPAGARL